MAFFKQIKPAINKVLTELFSDAELRTEIAYVKKGTVTGWDESLKQNVVQRTSYPLYAILLKHNRKTVEQSRSASVQVGDRLYMIRYKDAPPDMSLNDTFVGFRIEWAEMG